MAQGPRLRYASVMSTDASAGKVAALALTTPGMLLVFIFRL